MLDLAYKDFKAAIMTLKFFIKKMFIMKGQEISAKILNQQKELNGNSKTEKYNI